MDSYTHTMRISRVELWERDSLRRQEPVKVDLQSESGGLSLSAELFDAALSKHCEKPGQRFLVTFVPLPPEERTLHESFR